MKILIVQMSFLGDTILSTPVIDAVRVAHPEAELWMMVTPLAAGLFSHDTRLAGVITFDKRGAGRGLRGLVRMSRKLRNQQFDKVYSLHRSLRTALLLRLTGIARRVGFARGVAGLLYSERRSRPHGGHEVERNLALLASEVRLEKFSPRLTLTPPPWECLSSEVAAIIARRPYAVLVPGSEWETKRWDVKGFQDVAADLLRRGLHVILLGSAKERHLSDRIERELSVANLAGKVSIAETLAIVHRSSLVVSNDSMALHLASTFRVPSVTVFCSTSPSFGFGPWQNRGIVVEKRGLACKPCRRHGSRRCPNGTEACMKDLSSVEVINAVQEVLT